MSRPSTFEQQILSEVEQFLSENSDSYENRLQLLEAVSAYKSGCDVTKYWRIFNYPFPDISVSLVDKLTGLILKTNIPFSMAISSLSCEPLSLDKQKRNGVFYTDFRLAECLSKGCFDSIKHDSVVADYAAGTGILLVAIAELYKKKFPESFKEWVSKSLYAFDLSANALRGCRAAMLSLVGDIDCIKEMNEKWGIIDSLFDESIVDIKPDIIVGNPPWGKIKLSRHDFLLQSGEKRTYGSLYNDLKFDIFENNKDVISAYSKDIKKKFNLIGRAEPDMYMAFLQRVIELLSNEGHISFIVPSGLIHSKGTETFRRYLLKHTKNLEYILFDNKSNFFSIDSRFKFLILSFDLKTKEELGRDDFVFSFATADKRNILCVNSLNFEKDKLEKYRHDLSIPEVRNDKEMALFFKICEQGCPWGYTDDIWKASISREIDMTNDKKRFSSVESLNYIPIIEGRMVQQFRFGAKSYISGNGRSAIWKQCGFDGKSQFYYPKELLPQNIANRISHKRAGYCDIAGQTNERAMMSSIIPENVVCGNKVPTIIFPNDPTESLIYLWVGITNSFVFDWMIRRIISTTINYFLLFSIPMPPIDVSSYEAKEIITKVKQLTGMKKEFYNSALMSDLRSDIDVIVAHSYGLTAEDIQLILDDFPLIDKKQPSLVGEKKSTITRDIFLGKLSTDPRNKYNDYYLRYSRALEEKARSYIPTEMSDLSI